MFSLLEDTSSWFVNYFREPEIKGTKERFDTGFRIPTLISVFQLFFTDHSVCYSFLPRVR